MEAQLKAWILKEQAARVDRLASGSSMTGTQLAEWYNRETGVIQGLELVKDWMKEFNKKDHEDEET